MYTSSEVEDTEEGVVEGYVFWKDELLVATLAAACESVLQQGFSQSVQVSLSPVGPLDSIFTKKAITLCVCF